MTLNHRPYDAWHEGVTITEVRKHMHYSWNKLVVKVNGKLIQPEEYDTVTLEEEDDLQIIHLLAGG